MILYLSIFFLLGLVFGSFANVCIARIPAGQSIIFPRSRCPKCGDSISWFDNLPILSYLLLNARCRSCKAPISAQYPVVEFITGAAFLFIALYFRGTFMLPVCLIFTLLLIIISAIDFYHQIIPDGLSLALLIVGLCAIPVNFGLGSTITARSINSVCGILAGGGILLLIGFIGEKIMHKEAMGGGDIKLLGGIGALLGWSKIFPVLFVASIIGSVFGLYMILSKRIAKAGYIPFGPFLSLSAFLNLFLPNLTSFLFSIAK